MAERPPETAALPGDVAAVAEIPVVALEEPPGASAAEAVGASSDRLADEKLIATWQTVIDGFTRAHRRVMAPVEASGLPEPHFAALMLLSRADDHRLPMSRLAQELGMTSGGFTKLADRLARDGMIDRRNSVGDRRVVYAALTELGVTTVAAAESTYAGSVRRQVVAVVGDEALGQTAEVLRRLRDTGQTPLPADVDAPPFVPEDRDPRLPDRRSSPRD